MIKKGAGSHNQDVTKSLEHYSKSINIQKECRCILHKRGDKQGETISQTLFNRQGDGTQSMCSIGKTLIDSIKHKFWRLTHILVMELFTDGINMPVYNRLMNMTDDKLCVFKSNLKNIIHSNEILKFQQDFKNDFQIDDYFKAITYLKNELSLKGLGFYTIYFDSYTESFEFYEKLIVILEDITDTDNLKVIGEILEDLVDLSENQYFVPETAKIDVYENVKDRAYNWSKMNSLYTLVDGQYVKSDLFGPYHNTTATCGGEGNRLVKFLTEVDINNGAKAVTAFLMTNKAPGMHADHIFPLALGGKHTVKNMEFIPKKENLEKNASLTYASYLKVISSLSSLSGMINKDLVPLLLRFYETVEDDEKRFKENISMFEKQLKFKMMERMKDFDAMTEDQKLNFVGKIRPDLSSNRKQKFIERFSKHSKFSKQIKID
jgi:hypothetical protein